MQAEPPTPFLSIVLPFYNEQDCAAAVLRDLDATLSAAGLSFEIVAVQNGSQDGTAAILEAVAAELASVRVIRVRINRGFGYGVTEGLKAARGEVLGYMPGDGQIASAVVPELLARMRRQQAHVAQGQRRLRQDGWMRVWTSRAYNLLVQMLFRLPTGDVNGHPKLISRAAWDALALRSRDDFLDAEIMLKARRLGLHLASIDVVFLRRKTGRSKVRLRTCFQFFRNLIAARFLRHDPWGIHELEPGSVPPALSRTSRVDSDRRGDVIL